MYAEGKPSLLYPIIQPILLWRAALQLPVIYGGQALLLERRARCDGIPTTPLRFFLIPPTAGKLCCGVSQNLDKVSELIAPAESKAALIGS